jgi:hypothetical protein
LTLARTFEHSWPPVAASPDCAVHRNSCEIDLLFRLRDYRPIAYRFTRAAKVQPTA